MTWHLIEGGKEMTAITTKQRPVMLHQVGIELDHFGSSTGTLTEV